MTNLKRLLTTPLSRPLSKAAFIVLFVIAALGFVDAAYLSVEHYVNAIPPCSIGSCETVLTSQYSSVLGLPVSLYGAIFYLLVLVLLMIYKDTKKSWTLRTGALLSTAGAVIAIVLVLMMAFVIDAYCIYCLVSDTLTVILAICFWVILKKYRTHDL